MTQETKVQPQCPTVDELWADYEGQGKKVEELRNRWYEQSAEYDRLSNETDQAFQRAGETWEAYQDAQKQRDMAYDAAVEAECNCFVCRV